jgi:mannose-1-phosphate guanylyltransferase
MEERLLLTAGTLLKNRTFFKHEEVMLIHADNLTLFDMHAFMERFYTRASNIDITMMTFYTDVPQTCGIVELNVQGEVIAFHEKVKEPPGNLANAAVYILAPTVIDFMASLGKEVLDFSTEVLPHFLGRINTFHNSIYHRDIGNLESLTLAQIEYPAALSRMHAGMPSKLTVQGV